MALVKKKNHNTVDGISHFLSKIYKVLLSSKSMKIWCKYIKLPLPIYNFLTFSTNLNYFSLILDKKRPQNFWTKFEKIWHSDKRERELILPLGISKEIEHRIFLNKTPLGKKINFVVKKLITVAKAFAFRSARLPGERHYFESALTPLDLTMWVP